MQIGKRIICYTLDIVGVYLSIGFIAGTFYGKPLASFNLASYILMVAWIQSRYYPNKHIKKRRK